MSPEQASGGKVDARSDIFSFGAMLYEMVTGTRAFAGTSTADTLSAVLRAQPKPPSAIVPTVPSDLEKVIVRCLRKDGQIQDLVGKFAAENPKYRSALLSNPKGTIEKQLNTSLGAMSVKAVADTADTVHVVIPYAAAEGELSDSDLERVAGGKQDITANCLVLGGTAVSNTVMQLNL